MYCNGQCQHLKKASRRCQLTGEKLSYTRVLGPIFIEVYEHRGICPLDEAQKEMAEAR